jgi:hypothetical protein
MDGWSWQLLVCGGGAAERGSLLDGRYGPEGQGRMYGASGPGGRCRGTAPRYPAGECTAVYPYLQRRSQRLSGFAAAEHRLARGRTDRLLLDVQPCTPDRGAAEGRCSGGGAKERSRALCRVLECKSSFDRPCLAGRYYSCPLDEPHLWEALRYTELNPVRAGMVDTAEGWEWSSAVAHCSGSSGVEWLAMEMWRRRWRDGSWRGYLDAGQSESKLVAIRRYTHTGRPLGGAEFVRALERETKRLLALQKRGPKKKAHGEERQGILSFGA